MKKKDAGRRLGELRSWAGDKAKKISNDKRLRRLLESAQTTARKAGSRISELARDTGHKIQARIHHN